MSKERGTGQGGLFQEFKTVDGKSVLKSANWVAQYRVAGKAFRKSTGTPVKAEAEAILRDWMRDSEKGLKAAPQTQHLTYEDIRRDYIEYAVIHQLKSLKVRKDGTHSFNPLPATDAFFAGFKVSDIKQTAINAFIVNRREAGAANATINNSIALLHCMLQVAADNDKISVVPEFKLLDVVHRTGFLPPAQFQKLFDAIPARLQPLVLFLYSTGCRVGEAAKIEWSAVNLAAGTITLLQGETKNNESRILPLTPELVTLLERVTDRTGKVFPSKGVLQNAWKDALAKAEITGLLIHDLRRSAVRNLRRAGVSEGVAMKISGHKDRSVFERYNIKDEQDILEAGKLLQQSLPVVKIQRALQAAK